MQKISIFLVVLVLMSCTKSKKREIEYLLTKDSIQYFDLVTLDPQHPRSTTSISFSIDGTNDTYHFSTDDTDRHIWPYFKEPNEYGKSNQWKILNDSTIESLGAYPIIIRRFTEDSIFLRFSDNKRVQAVLVRIKGDPKISKKSIRERDSLYIEFKKQKELNKNAMTVEIPAEK